MSGGRTASKLIFHGSFLSTSLECTEGFSSSKILTALCTYALHVIRMGGGLTHFIPLKP